MDPITGMAIGAGISGIGSYFQGSAEEQAAAQAAKVQEEQLAFQKQQYADQQKAKQTASGIVGSGISTDAYGNTLNYVDPLANQKNATLASMMSGQLTTAQQAQMQNDVATAGQTTNSSAATMGLPAGARLAVNNQNVQGISRNYADVASNEMAAGVSGANTAANTGSNIASTNYQSGLANWMNQQQQQNLKTQSLAQYAV